MLFLQLGEAEFNLAPEWRLLRAICRVIIPTLSDEYNNINP